MLHRVALLRLWAPAVVPIRARRIQVRVGPIARRPQIVSFPLLTGVVPFPVRPIELPVRPVVVEFLVLAGVVQFPLWPHVVPILAAIVIPAVALRAVVLPVVLGRAVVSSARFRPDLPAPVAVPVVVAVACRPRESGAFARPRPEEGPFARDASVLHGCVAVRARIGGVGILPLRIATALCWSFSGIVTARRLTGIPAGQGVCVGQLALGLSLLGLRRQVEIGGDLCQHTGLARAVAYIDPAGAAVSRFAARGREP